MTNTPYLHLFQHLRELNRAFLTLLQTRARAQRGCLDLPLALRPALRSAAAERLDALAEFPRALFRIRCDAPASALLEEAARVESDAAERTVTLSILLAARQTCRQSVYQARLVFALEPREVEQLGALSLGDIQVLAGRPGLLQCAFCERQWFWSGLLTATHPESRRQLTLMALQPGTAPRWTGRRPPRATA